MTVSVKVNANTHFAGVLFLSFKVPFGRAGYCMIKRHEIYFYELNSMKNGNNPFIRENNERNF
jgi:hypothetical protein